jgi:hypothetical protein
MILKKISLLAIMTLAVTSVMAQNDESVMTATLKLDEHFSEPDGGRNNKYAVQKVKFISVDSDSYHNGDKYTPSNLIDSDNSTAWVANQKYLDYPQKDAKGSTAYFKFSNGDEPLIIEIVPGYLKNKSTWDENTRVKKIRITYLNEQKDMKEPIIDAVVELQLKDGKLPMQSQYVNLMPFYVHNMAMTDFSTIRLEILETENGSKYQDACISSVNFYKMGGQIKK